MHFVKYKFYYIFLNLANVDGLNQVVVVTLVARYPCVEIRDALAFEMVSFVRTRSAIVARATGTFVNI